MVQATSADLAQVESVPLAAWPAEGASLNSSDAVREEDQFGNRFAAFATGCLGAATPAKAGDKLGLMGSVSEEELVYTLRHLETLSRQRAAKLAGVAVGQNASVPGGAICTAPFERALRDALVAPGGDPQAVVGEEGGNLASQLFRLLPHDQSGRADLLNVFGLAPEARGNGLVQQADGADSVAKQVDVGFDFCAEYAEDATDLPSASLTDRRGAERHLLKLEDAAESGWESAAAAINAIRSALVQMTNSGAGTDGRNSGTSASEDSVIIVVGRCCGSRRPALAKSALRLLLELAEAKPEVSCLSSAEWSCAAEAAVTGCLAALRATKAAGKIAEAAIAAVVQRVATDASPAVAAGAILGCLGTASRARPPQAPVVAAGLRALLPVLPRLADESGSLETAGSLCEEVLNIRALSVAYSEARAVQRELKKLSDSASSTT